MVFLDETGRRWRRIKLGTGMLSGAALVPIAVLLGASFLYLPSWGSFSLPQSFGAASNSPNPGENTLAPQTSVNKAGSSNSTANQSTTKPSASGSASSSVQPSASAVVSDPSTIDIISQPAAEPAQSSQPAQTGNRDYGTSHQPIRS